VCVTKADKTGLCETVSQRMRERGGGEGMRESKRETETKHVGKA